MGHTIHDKTRDAKKARILVNALADCAKANARSVYPIKDMLCGVSLYLEKGNFMRENWSTWHRRTPKSVKTICGHDTAKPRRAKTRQRVRQSRLARNHPDSALQFSSR